MMNDMFSSDVPQCWICHDEGVDDFGQPLRRDCSCRGSTSGFAHLSCLIENAKFQTIQWDCHDLGELKRPWLICVCCNQSHQKELRIELATEFVSFVEEQHPVNHWILAIALYEKLVSVGPNQFEATIIANKILCLINQMKIEYGTLPKQLLFHLIEARAYYYLGCIALNDGMKDGAKEALKCFEKCRDLGSVSPGMIIEVAMAEKHIDMVKEKCGEVISKERKVELSQNLYESRLKVYGEERIDTLYAGKHLAISLLNVRRLVEAERLLKKLAAVSKQVHGLDHTVTKSINSAERRLGEIKVNNWLAVLRYTTFVLLVTISILCIQQLF